jgi:hypothetical protein
MGFQQYHEPANELSQETRTFARMIASLIEEADAINWYEQRLSVEKDPDAKAIMADAQGEEFKHFGMDLEFLLRRKPKWKRILQEILFQGGDIVKRGEQAEEDNEWRQARALMNKRIDVDSFTICHLLRIPSALIGFTLYRPQILCEAVKSVG